MVKAKVNSLTRTTDEVSVMINRESPSGSGMEVSNYNYNIKIARLIQRISDMNAASDLDKQKIDELERQVALLAQKKTKSDAAHEISELKKSLEEQETKLYTTQLKLEDTMLIKSQISEELVKLQTQISIFESDQVTSAQDVTN